MNSNTDLAQNHSRDRLPVGWPEILGGLIGFYAVGHAMSILFKQFDTDAVTSGVFTAQLAGIAALGGFALALALRTRRLEPFGFAKTTPKWLVLGVIGGAVLFVVKGFVAAPLAELFNLSEGANPELAAGAQGGLMALVLTSVGLAVIGPVGEEALFRGVIQTALLRYGALISTLGSALIFTAVHGINAVMPVAFLFGLLSAELYRRSGSIWPAIVAHIVHNAPTPFLFLVL